MIPVMAYDHELADRIRERVAGEDNETDRLVE